MNKEQLSEIVNRMTEVNSLVKSLEPEVRGVAFDMLKPYITGAEKDKPAPKQVGPAQATTGSTLSEFFADRDQTKPSENVFLIAAWYYSQFGATPLTTKKMAEIATQVGLILPERPDATMNAKKVEGKPCFHRKADGYSPTVHGEKFLSTTFNVRKGTNAFVSESVANA